MDVLLEKELLTFLVEDQTVDNKSYVDFICLVHKYAFYEFHWNNLLMMKKSTDKFKKKSRTCRDRKEEGGYAL